MSAENPEGLRTDLLDDFYAECDELLSGLRRNISAVEDTLRRTGPDQAGVEELFRAMHSLKGICGIVGLRPAENLAHAVEDLLRAMTHGQAGISLELLDLILAATERLDKIVGAHRHHRALPETADLLPKLSAALGRAPAAEPRPAAEPGASTTPAVRAPAGPTVNWRATFAPSPALDARGIKVAAIRARLLALGPVVSAAPTVKPGGGLRFVFDLALAESPADLPGWEKDGVHFESVAAPAAGESSADTMGVAPSHIVRVSLQQLDELMRITGEIVIHRSRLQDRLGARERGNDDLKAIDAALGRSLRELRAAVSRVRLVPVAEIFSRMPYVLRDLARDAEKKVRMLLEGEQTEIDKYLVERLKEPLLHLVRNSFVHGVDTPAERAAAGKPPEAVIRLGATRIGDAAEITISDDGRGIDAAAVAARAASLGLPVPAVMDEAGILSVLCLPGFSTRDEADRAAGRGVGMAVVLTTVQELGGTLRLETAPGRGTTFILRLPLTLSIADALIVAIGGQVCALPQSHVEEIVQVQAGEARFIQRTEVVPYRGALLPLFRLRAMFGLDAPTEPMLTIVVVNSTRGSTGIVVDRALSRREVVIRALTDPLVRVRGISGATELGDGRPVLILDPDALTSGVVRPAIDLSAPLPEGTQATHA